jgi:hypothetical protein
MYSYVKIPYQDFNCRVFMRAANSCGRGYFLCFLNSKYFLRKYLL